MKRPDPQVILRDARRLKDERFATRNADLKERREIRFRKKKPIVPEAYNDSATVFMSAEIEEQGRQIAALIYAPPVVHVPPPRPEDQALTTKAEVFAHAALQELENENGSVGWVNTLAQVHDRFSVIYFGAKRKAYADQPKAPDDGADDVALLAFQLKNNAYKKEAGIASVFDLRHVPTESFLYVGNHRNPVEVYEWKDVDERELIAKYGLTKEGDGSLSLPKDETTLPSGPGAEEGSRGQARMLTVVEYWDREWCMIVLQNANGRWRGGAGADALVLEEWQHNWGRVPYFCAPAFENELLDEAMRFESPIDGLYAEIPEYNNRRTMFSNTAYLLSYPTWQRVTKDVNDAMLDAKGDPLVETKFKPGVIYHPKAGSEIMPVPMQAGPQLFQELLAMEQRMERYSLSPVSRGQSPGADTANSALTQLHRAQRHALSPLNLNQSNQYRPLFQFMFARIKGSEDGDIGETVYVYSADKGEMVDLSPEEIVTMNIQVKVAPDTGQDNLIEEKQAAEMRNLGYLTAIGYYERIGKENPEEWVRAETVERYWIQREPALFANVDANLGDVQAINALIAANQETGDARNAVPDIMEQIRAGQTGEDGGMGSGRPGMPSAMGVGDPAVAQTTQPSFAGGQNAPG